MEGLFTPTWIAPVGDLVKGQAPPCELLYHRLAQVGLRELLRPAKFVVDQEVELLGHARAGGMLFRVDAEGPDADPVAEVGTIVGRSPLARLEMQLHLRLLKHRRPLIGKVQYAHAGNTSSLPGERLYLIQGPMQDAENFLSRGKVRAVMQAPCLPDLVEAQTEVSGHFG